MGLKRGGLMHFNNEKLADRVYMVRGYREEDDERFILVLTLVGDENNDYEVKGMLTQITLKVGEFKSLIKYMQSLGMKMHADVLRQDFKKFYGKKNFERIKL